MATTEKLLKPLDLCWVWDKELENWVACRIRNEQGQLRGDLLSVDSHRVLKRKSISLENKLVVSLIPPEPPDPKETKYILVHWVDSCVTVGEVDKKDIGELAVMKTVGILVENREDQIIIARDLHTNRGSWRDCISIPQVCVKSTCNLLEEAELEGEE